MSDWQSGVFKVKPGLKAYLFIGTAHNAVDELIGRALEGIDHVLTLRPPLTVHGLGTILGMPEEKQAILVRGMESASVEDWIMLARFLEPNKIKGRSLVLTGTAIPESPEATAVRTKISRQGVFVDVKDPGGDLGRRYLAEWFGEVCKVMVADAQVICARVQYSIEALVWIKKKYLALSGGRVLPRNVSQKLLAVCTPESISDAFSLMLHKDKSAARIVERFDTSQRFQWFHMLESALTDISLMQPHAEDSVKKISDETGLHVVRVLELKDYISMYPPQVMARCRRALDIGFAHSFQPEAAKTVALLWS